MPERVIDALVDLSGDHTLWQPHDFTQAMSAGLGEALEDDSARSLFESASEARLHSSIKIDRADNRPYLYNFLGHVIVHGMRHKDKYAEVQLSEYVASPENANNPLHSPEYWKKSIIRSFEELHVVQTWPSFCLRDTSSCVESRFKAALWGLAAHRVERDGGFAGLTTQPEPLRVADFGSSVNFALAGLLRSQNTVVLSKDTESKTISFQPDYGIGIDQLMDEPLRKVNIRRSWTRSCSIPLRDLAKQEAVQGYDRRVQEVVALRDEGIITQVRMVPGYDPHRELKPELRRVIDNGELKKPNTAIHSTYLHQLNDDGRSTMLEVARESIEDDGVQIVVDFANVVDGKVQFAEDRWHGHTGEEYPYGAMIEIDGQWYETARSKSSRCNEDNPHIPENSIFRNYGIDTVQVVRTV